jgi:hypothetical protein
MEMKEILTNSSMEDNGEHKTEKDLFDMHENGSN